MPLEHLTLIPLMTSDSLGYFPVWLHSFLPKCPGTLVFFHFQNMQNLFQPQGFCSCWSLCQVLSPPTPISVWLSLNTCYLKCHLFRDSDSCKPIESSPRQSDPFISLRILHSTNYLILFILVLFLVWISVSAHCNVNSIWTRTSSVQLQLLEGSLAQNGHSINIRWVNNNCQCPWCLDNSRPLLILLAISLATSYLRILHLSTQEK